MIGHKPVGNTASAGRGVRARRVAARRAERRRSAAGRSAVSRSKTARRLRAARAARRVWKRIVMGCVAPRCVWKCFYRGVF